MHFHNTHLRVHAHDGDHDLHENDGVRVHNYHDHDDAHDPNCCDHDDARDHLCHGHVDAHAPRNHDHGGDQEGHGLHAPHHYHAGDYVRDHADVHDHDRDFGQAKCWVSHRTHQSSQPRIDGHDRDHAHRDGDHCVHEPLDGHAHGHDHVMQKFSLDSLHRHENGRNIHNRFHHLPPM